MAFRFVGRSSSSSFLGQVIRSNRFVSSSFVQTPIINNIRSASALPKYFHSSNDNVTSHYQFSSDSLLNIDFRLDIVYFRYLLSSSFINLFIV